ncbi:hypothetical protein F5Y08DRAFT_337748 [Xylaria arbuscula]|nr:hypothetical protein F5Y08DRAFT_337748 [Xylaria arbuscula]
MDQLLKLKRADGIWNPLMPSDPRQEIVSRSLQVPSEICVEENECRVANRRFSDVFPLQKPLNIFVSAPPTRKVNGYLDDAFTNSVPHLPKKQNESVPSYLYSNSHPNTHSLDSEIAQSPTDQISSKSPLVITEAHMPSQRPKLHPYYPLVSHAPCLPAVAPSCLPREDSAASLLSLEARDSSIRIVKPNLTLSPPHKPRDFVINEGSEPSQSTNSEKGSEHQAIMYGNGNKRYGQALHNPQESSRKPQIVDARVHSHSRSDSQRSQLLEAPEAYGYTQSSSTSKSDHSVRDSSIRSSSTDRGRTMQRRYEFIDSDDKTYPVPSPVQATDKRGNGDSNSKSFKNAGHESNITTMTDLMQRCIEQPPPPPAPRNHRQKQLNGNNDISAAQLSLPQLKEKQRPPALNLRNPVHIGMVSRNTNRYQIEHTAIKSSKAEHFDSYSLNDNTSVYDYREDSPTIAPLNIPKRNYMNAVNSLQAYTEWRENLRPVHTASQGSIHIIVPSQEEDASMPSNEMCENLPQIVGPHTAQNKNNLNNMRSRSALGIREDNNQARFHQPSGDSGYTASEYSTDMTPGIRSGIMRSATLNERSHQNRQCNDGSEVKANQDGALMDGVQQLKETVPPSPFTPLTPFIMRVSGAPAGVEQGAKTLFGEHGWLEDTAASEVKKPKMEKTGRFMENLMRRARELADSTSFKPTRHSRASSVSHVNVSLDAREQSLLYCELEYNLNTALDAYFRTQLNTGRLEASKLSRIADTWAQKGRPKVSGFRYDLETQVDLIAAHINDFRFYGPVQAEGLAAVAGLLQAMKTNARYMRIRTFCQPDSVIAKHVLDSQSLLRLLGSPENLQRPLEEVAQFFKVAVDRRKAIMAQAPPGRDFSDGSTGRIISNGSGQRVRFQDNAERNGSRIDIPNRSKSRAGVRDNGSVFMLVRNTDDTDIRLYDFASGSGHVAALTTDTPFARSDYLSNFGPIRLQKLSIDQHSVFDAADVLFATP